MVPQVFADPFNLQVDGISIVGQLYLPGKGPKFPLVCLCHGVPSGSPPAPGDGGYSALAERFCREGYAAVIFNFRGSGESGGNFDLLGWTRDLQAIIDHVYHHDSIDNSYLFLAGFSGGAATAVYVASKDKRVTGLAACACPANFGLAVERDGPQATIDRYRSIGIIRDNYFPSSVEEWFNDLQQVTPVNHVSGISPRPLLLVHGSLDETVPVSHAYELYDKAGEPKQLIVLDGAGHRLRQEEGAVVAVLDWLKSLCDDST